MSVSNLFHRENTNKYTTGIKLCTLNNLNTINYLNNYIHSIIAKVTFRQQIPQKILILRFH